MKTFRQILLLIDTQGLTLLSPETAKVITPVERRSEKLPGSSTRCCWWVQVSLTRRSWARWLFAPHVSLNISPFPGHEMLLWTQRRTPSPHSSRLTAVLLVSAYKQQMSNCYYKHFHVSSTFSHCKAYVKPALWITQNRPEFDHKTWLKELHEIRAYIVCKQEKWLPIQSSYWREIIVWHLCSLLLSFVQQKGQYKHILEIFIFFKGIKDFLGFKSKENCL